MKTILLIDDNLEIRENTTEILELAGYKVLAAENGKIGVNLANSETPDLILCDIMMPVMDGFEVFLAISKNLRTAGTPFIFLTAKAEVADKKYGFNFGIDDYITKPYDDDLLLSVIENRIHKHEKAKEELGLELFKYLNELEDMLHLTNHKVRAPLTTCLGLIQLLDKKSGNSQKDEELMEILIHIKNSILTLDDFTRELTHFLEVAKQKKKNKLGITTHFPNSPD